MTHCSRPPQARRRPEPELSPAPTRREARFLRLCRFELSASILLALTLATSALHAKASDTVLELFTSQGCSSCPPADELLGELGKRSGVIALAFHVDYWDRLGWKDPFSSPEATQRQRRYARRFERRSVYTPQLVIDGQNHYVGSRRATIERAITDSHTRATERTPLELQTTSPQTWMVSMPSSAHRAAELTALFVQFEAETGIEAGENAGRQHRDFFIVRAMQTIDFDAQFTLPRTTNSSNIDAVVVLWQKPRQGEILGSAKLDL